MEKYIAKYFLNTEKIINQFKKDDIVMIQFFQRYNDVMLCGMQEVLKFLEDNSDTSKYKIKYLKDGTIISENEIILELEGHYSHFGKFEGIIDGILARSSSIATNSYHIKKVANQKKVIAMTDRQDHYLMQKIDGYAIKVGGIEKLVTQKQVESFNGIPLGTIPHALIQSFNGDLIKALETYHQAFPRMPLIALVDFNNNVIEDSLKVLSKFKDKLSGVRVDTSPNIVDKSFKNPKVSDYGVSMSLIKKLRKQLDLNGGKNVEIIVSSGFDKTKIKKFEDNKIPVDYYGVGQALMKVWINFSADAVRLNYQNIAKFGRKYHKNSRLISLN